MNGNKTTLNIGIITNEGFPSGMSTTNRILSIAQGLVELKQKVTVFCVRSTENKSNIINREIQGQFKGINYLYTSGTIIWPDKKIKKLLVTIRGFLGFFLCFKRRGKGNPFDFVLCTTSSYFFNYYYCKYIRFLKGVPILAIDEYPRVLRNKSNYNKYYSQFYVKTFYKFFDGAIIMTKILTDFYRPLMKKEIPIIHLPMTVDCERFTTNIKESPIEYDYIAYCGNIGQNQKDGVPILIEAFSIIKKKHPDIKLVIIGGTNPSVYDVVLSKLKSIVRKFEVEKDIIFTGKIHRDEMPKYLNHAKILALARPTSLQSHGGFPTKLGEYLATGKPVVVTSVGEIPFYLKDKYNAFIAEPDSATSFAEKLQFVLDNPELASQVGKEGEKLAKTVFNYKVQSIELLNYLYKIKENL